MTTSSVESQLATALSVETTEDSLTVFLSDGRTLSVPLGWYPRLACGTPEERGNWSLSGMGHGIHWPDLDEDISVENLLLGQRSGESQTSFQKWLEKRGSSLKSVGTGPASE